MHFLRHRIVAPDQWPDRVDPGTRHKTADQRQHGQYKAETGQLPEQPVWPVVRNRGVHVAVHPPHATTKPDSGRLPRRPGAQSPLPPRCERTTVTLVFHLPSPRYRQTFPDETAPLPSDTHMSFRFIFLLRAAEPDEVLARGVFPIVPPVPRAHR